MPLECKTLPSTEQKYFQQGGGNNDIVSCWKGRSWNSIDKFDVHDNCYYLHYK